MSNLRTARQITDAGLVLRIACRCGHESFMDPLTVSFIYGDGFDFYQDQAELYAVIRCEACGAARPVIDFTPGRVAEDGRAIPVETTHDYIMERPSRRAGHR
jgi:hypothetical protein